VLEAPAAVDAVDRGGAGRPGHITNARDDH
jgi:hypothetical protein